MALWKPFRGSRADLDAVEKHDGYVYFCDDGTLFFDYTDVDGNLQRKQINENYIKQLSHIDGTVSDIQEIMQAEFDNIEATLDDIIANQDSKVCLKVKTEDIERYYLVNNNIDIVTVTEHIIPNDIINHDATEYSGGGTTIDTNEELWWIKLTEDFTVDGEVLAVANDEFIYSVKRTDAEGNEVYYFTEGNNITVSEYIVSDTLLDKESFWVSEEFRTDTGEEIWYGTLLDDLIIDGDVLASEGDEVELVKRSGMSYILTDEIIDPSNSELVEEAFTETGEQVYKCEAVVKQLVYYEAWSEQTSGGDSGIDFDMKLPEMVNVGPTGFMVESTGDVLYSGVTAEEFFSPVLEETLPAGTYFEFVIREENVEATVYCTLLNANAAFNRLREYTDNKISETNVAWKLHVEEEYHIVNQADYSDTGIIFPIEYLDRDTIYLDSVDGSGDYARATGEEVYWVRPTEDVYDENGEVLYWADSEFPAVLRLKCKPTDEIVEDANGRLLEDNITDIEEQVYVIDSKNEYYLLEYNENDYIHIVEPRIKLPDWEPTNVIEEGMAHAGNDTYIMKHIVYFDKDWTDIRGTTHGAGEGIDCTPIPTEPVYYTKLNTGKSLNKLKGYVNEQIANSKEEICWKVESSEEDAYYVTEHFEEPVSATDYLIPNDIVVEDSVSSAEMNTENTGEKVFWVEFSEDFIADGKTFKTDYYWFCVKRGDLLYLAVSPDSIIHYDSIIPSDAIDMDSIDRDMLGYLCVNRDGIIDGWGEFYEGDTLGYTKLTRAKYTLTSETVGPFEGELLEEVFTETGEQVYGVEATVKAPVYYEAYYGEFGPEFQTDPPVKLPPMESLSDNGEVTLDTNEKVYTGITSEEFIHPVTNEVVPQGTEYLCVIREEEVTTTVYYTLLNTGKSLNKLKSYIDDELDLSKKEQVGKPTDGIGEIFNAYGDRVNSEGTISLNVASGEFSHAEGMDTQALREQAHAEGRLTVANGVTAHAEGLRSQALSSQAHAEGRDTIASGSYGSHAEGYKTQALSRYSHAEGRNTQAGTHNDADEGGLCAHAEGNSTKALGDYSHAEGTATEATGQHSHAEGEGTQATGRNAHAEGFSTKATEPYTHAEGMASQANAESAHAEGISTHANGTSSHAEGENTEATHRGAHAEGYMSKASGQYSHSEGNTTQAIGHNSHSEGKETQSQGGNSHTEGYLTVAVSENAHAEGKSTIARGNQSHAEGESTSAIGTNSHTEGIGTKATGDDAHAQGYYTIASGEHSNAIGYKTTASGKMSHAEGYSYKSSSEIEGDLYTVWKDLGKDTAFTVAQGQGSHAEGRNTFAAGSYSHTEGRGTYTEGANSHAEGSVSQAIGPASHAEGLQSKAIGYYSHSEGAKTEAQGENSHSEGKQTVASGISSHAEGMSTKAEANYSHAGGYYTQATTDAQTAIGKYNAVNDDALFIVGNGTSKNRQNAFEVLEDGRAVIQTAPIDDMDVVNKAYADKTIKQIEQLDDKVENIETNLTVSKTITGNPIVLEDLPENPTVNIINSDVVPVFVSSGKAIEWLDWELGSCIIHENSNIISKPVDYQGNGPRTYGQSIDNTPGAINKVLITETVLPTTANYTNIEIEATADISVYCIIQSDPNSEPEQIDSTTIDLTDITAEVNDNILSIYGTFITPEPWLEGGRIAGSEATILYTLDKLNLSTTGTFEDYKFVDDFDKLTNYPVFSPITSIIGRYSYLTVEYLDIANISNYATKEHVSEVDNRLTTNINDVDSNSRDRDTYLDDKNTELEGKIQKTNTELSTKIQETNEQLSTEIKELEKHTLNLLPHNTVNGNSIFVNDVSPSEHNLDITLTDSDAGTFIAVSSEEIQTITARDNYLDIYGYGKWAQLDYLDKVQYIATTGYGSARPAFGGNYPDGEDYFLSLAIADEICDIKYYKVELDDEGNPHKSEQVIDRPDPNVGYVYCLESYADDQYPMYESSEIGLFCADINDSNYISVDGEVEIWASYSGNDDGQVWGTMTYTGYDIDHRNFPITLSLKGTCEPLSFPEGSGFVTAHYFIGQNFTITVGKNNKITIPETKIYTSSANIKSIAPNMCITTNNPNTTITCTYNQDMSKVFAPLIVTTDEDGLATCTPAEIFDYVKSGGSVFFEGHALAWVDEYNAYFNFIGDDRVYEVYAIAEDRSIDELCDSIPSASELPGPPLMVTRTSSGLASHSRSEIKEHMQKGGTVYFEGHALSYITDVEAYFDYVSDETLCGTFYIDDDRQIQEDEYGFLDSEVAENLYAAKSGDNTFTGDNVFNGDTEYQGETIYNSVVTFNGDADFSIAPVYTGDTDPHGIEGSSLNELIPKSYLNYQLKYKVKHDDIFNDCNDYAAAEPIYGGEHDDVLEGFTIPDGAIAVRNSELSIAKNMYYVKVKGLKSAAFKETSEIVQEVLNTLPTWQGGSY